MGRIAEVSLGVGDRWVGVVDAAQELGVDPRQVRRLVAAGDLVGRRVGGVWLIDGDSVRDRRLREPVAGRPLSAPMAWGVLAVLAGCAADGASEVGGAIVLDRRSWRRLWGLLEDPPPVERWPQWMRGRVQRLRVRVHPGVIDRLASDGRLRCVDPSVVLGVGGVRRCLFVGEGDLAGLVEEYRAVADPGGVDLLVLPAVSLAVSDGCPEVLVLSAVVDLVASVDARERDAARRVLAGAIAEHAGRCR
jgi:hypothetical protein